MIIPRIAFLEVHDGTELPVDFHNQYHTHLYCHRGSIKFLLNDKKLHCKKGEFLFWFAESSISNISFSSNFKASILLVEKKFLYNNVPDQSWSIDAILYSRQFPIKPITNDSDKQKILSNFRSIYDRFLETDHRFYEEALKLQMQIFILEMWHTFANMYERHKRTLQTGTLYENFTQLLQQYCMQEREVQFYSTKLHITAKYLNQVCKNNTGITASEWIQRYTKERIIFLLQNKNLNIAEIANRMNFSSRSFFTRYVKKQIGVTPSEYRKRLEDRNKK
ncbi:helix-turn-helix domain-containing protein [Salegentibacter sp. 24]|uniref:helix-turn-helix domain-containing protein n=1 Tax=Salegentibacter sp. 24 TaxID=2183986 RepID=UPI001FB6CEC1|nr:helix-turn-helix domain-containing protein [Salegentibacter sp. 24]